MKNLEVSWDKRNGSPQIISFDLPVSFSTDQKESADNFIKQIKKLLDYREDNDSLILVKTNEHRGRKYLRYQQWYKGVHVKGGEYVVTVMKDGKVKTALGSFYKDLNIDTKPTITFEGALQFALENPPEEKKLKELANSSELIIFTKDDINYLAYELHIECEIDGVCWCYIIDATNGNILKLREDALHISQANIYSRHPVLDGSYTLESPLKNLYNNGYLQGTYVKVLNNEENDGYDEAYNANNDFRYSTDNVHFDEANLYYHVDAIATYFHNLGFDGFTQITAHAHWGTNYYDTKYDFSDGHIKFTDDQITDYHSAALEDKIIYHEYTHAITDNVANLSFLQEEAGAIHEGNSDYFAGSFTDRSKLGEYFFIH